MKTRLFTRLSALTAGLTVALAGSLAAMPAAHAATTYQLNQVGGSVAIQQVTFIGETTPVPGQFSNGFTVTGEKRSWTSQHTFKVGFSLGDLSKLQAGDKVVIPVTSPSPMLSPSVAPLTGTVGNQSVGPAFNVTASGQSITFTATSNAASYSSVSGDMTFAINSGNLGVQGTQEEWRIDVGNDYYTIYHLPMINANDGLAIGTSNYTYINPSYTTKPQPNLDFRLPGLANAAIDGTLSTKFPEAVNGDIWQYAVITPLTRPVVVTVNENVTNTQQLAYDGVHFAGQDGGPLGRHIAFTKKTVKAADLTKPEDTLKVLSPGEYALFDNGDGTWTYAVNWGKWQNNERTAIPNPVPTNITDAALKAKLDEYRTQGYGVSGVRSRVQLEFQDVTSNSTQMYKVDLVNGIGTKALNVKTMTSSNSSGDISGDGNLVDATVFYSANGATSGSAPANQTSTVGTKVTIASKGNLARTGYTFNGWNTAANGTGTAYTENQQVTLPRNGLRLYAQWKANNYNVTFDKNAADATGTTAALTGKPYGSKVTLTANGFKRTGYTFAGWNTQADGKGTAYADKAQFTIPNGNTTLYAQWVEEDLVEIYRMYDGIEHLYVNNTTERDALVARGWKFEGVAFYTPATSSTPVHRLYHPATGDHHYTSDPTEIGSLTSQHGWRDEGTLFYGDDAQRVELKRLFMAGLGKGEHLHTADPTELKVLTTKHGWDLEGVSFYVAKYGG